MKKLVPKPLVLPIKAKTTFNKLKECFLKAPLLRHFNSTKKCTVETDTSEFALNVILSQKQEDSHRHPIVFYFRKLNLTEMNYGTSDCELLAIVVTFKT